MAPMQKMFLTRSRGCRRPRRTRSSLAWVCGDAAGKNHCRRWFRRGEINLFAYRQTPDGTRRTSTSPHRNPTPEGVRTSIFARRTSSPARHRLCPPTRWNSGAGGSTRRTVGPLCRKCSSKSRPSFAPARRRHQHRPTPTPRKRAPASTSAETHSRTSTAISSATRNRRRERR